MPEEDSDDDDSEYIEDATPGPGYYYDPHGTTSFKKQYKEHRFQIFGSASTRFTKQEQQDAANAVGPGEYFKEGEDRTFVKKTYNKKKRLVPFEATSKRFEKGILVPNKNPGPGQYEDEHTVRSIKITPACPQCRAKGGPFHRQAILLNF